MAEILPSRPASSASPANGSGLTSSGDAASQKNPASSSSSSSSSFVFPHYYHFPPLFTLQPNLATRRAQMDKWTTLVLAYCRHYRIHRLAVEQPPQLSPGDHEGPIRIEDEDHKDDDPSDSEDPNLRPVTYCAPDLFTNRHIGRTLPTDAVREVFASLRREGRLSWPDDKKDEKKEGSWAFVYWKKPDEWAAVVDAWIDDTAQRGAVLTLYELTAGEAARGSELYGLDPAVLHKALAVLVKRGKAQIFGAEESLGVKFF